MNKRALMILVIAAGALLVAVIILLIVARTQVPQPTDVDTITVTNTTVATNADITDSTGTPTTTPDTTPVTNAPVDDATSINRLARNFTERYTSYSTDTHYENIEQSRSMMTDAMSSEADKIISQSEQDNADFYSVVTQVTSVTLTDFSDGATGATAEVAVRQSAITGQADPIYQNRTARLTFKKDGAAWQVDSFRWL